jgi:hypothetical protein
MIGLLIALFISYLMGTMGIIVKDKMMRDIGIFSSIFILLLLIYKEVSRL